MSYYYKISIWSEDEVLAIYQADTDKYDPVEVNVINRLLNRDHDWKFLPITQAEFETYQAFGIKEIKL